jgi:hypothetical protein
MVVMIVPLIMAMFMLVDARGVATARGGLWTAVLRANVVG